MIGPPRFLAGVLERLSGRFSIVPLTEGRRPEFLRFLERAYADQPILPFREPKHLAAHWQWLQSYPGENSAVARGWLALRQEKIVGHFGILPVQVHLRGREIEACWGRDLIVASEARGSGAGALLMAAVALEAGIPFLIAGLNERSYGLFRRIGFRDLGRIPLHLRFYQPGALLSTLIRPFWLRRAAEFWIRFGKRPARWNKTPGLTVRPLERFDEEFDHWWNRLADSFPCVIRRTRRTMSWRYLQHPRHRYTTLVARDLRGWRGLAVVRHGPSRGFPAGFITELLAPPGDTAILAALLSEAEEFLLRSAPKPLVFLRCALFHPSLQRALYQAGFLQVPSPLHWMTANGNAGTSQGAFWRRTGWMLNAGDSDLDAV